MLLFWRQSSWQRVIVIDWRRSVNFLSCCSSLIRFALAISRVQSKSTKLFRFHFRSVTDHLWLLRVFSRIAVYFVVISRLWKCWHDIFENETLRGFIYLEPTDSCDRGALYGPFCVRGWTGPCLMRYDIAISGQTRRPLIPSGWNVRHRVDSVYTMITWWTEERMSTSRGILYSIYSISDVSWSFHREAHKVNNCRWLAATVISLCDSAMISGGR